FRPGSPRIRASPPILPRNHINVILRGSWRAHNGTCRSATVAMSFHGGQGTDLLIFITRVLELTLHRWLAEK
ncbi:MAG: hypothetical protein HN884_10335, partial [Rhodospirillaceae bacterium]|nr:hypothetical protein [Rhodospirillaceae bacterium]